MQTSLVTVCARCHKFRTAQSSWEPLSRLLPELAKRCSHGYCPTCYEQAIREIEEQKKTILATSCSLTGSLE